MRLTLTKQAEYALRILVWMAEGTAEAGPAGANGEAPRQKAATIAAATDVPPVFATRVLALLQRQGMLRARAGQQGGYTLARPAGQISLLEIVEAVEGPLVSPECVLRDSPCNAGDPCVLHDAWSTAREALRTVLAGTSLDDAVTNSPRTGSFPTALLVRPNGAGLSASLGFPAV